MNTPDSNHPITPTDKLLYQWCAHNDQHATIEEFWEHIATQAARWGADQELEECVNYVDNTISGNKARALRAIRRPKPPSLKEQALSEVAGAVAGGNITPERGALIRKALEQL